MIVSSLGDPAVVLVCAPWASASRPSLALSLLEARLEQAGIEVRSLYPNLWFADAVGPERYERYGYHHSVFNQYVFSELLFGAFQPEGRSFTQYLRARGVCDSELAELTRVRALVPALTDWCFSAVDWRRVCLVGFTTTFLQTLPALALARALSERFVHLKIVLGGAGCHGEMGRAIFRNFEFVDGVVRGESEDGIVALAEAVMLGREPELPGLLWRGVDGEARDGGEPRLADLAAYVEPQHRGFFEQRREFPALARGPAELPFEASRGCWWGTIKHCRFCGLNGETMIQRVRSLDAVVTELARARERFGVTLFLAADNILAREHIDALPQQLRAGLPEAELFFEVRVTMRRRQLAGLAAAGVRYMQPGIESLIPEVLELVDKGTTPLLNLVFLRRARELGIHVDWNLMCGLPGEQRPWYQALLERMPSFFHLQAPDLVRFGLQRFSPFFEQPAAFGIENTSVMPGSEYVWDLPEPEIKAMAFEWAFTTTHDWSVDELLPELGASVERWQASSARLTAERTSSGQVVVHDTRPNAERELCVLDHDSSRLLRSLEKPLSFARALAAVGARAGASMTEAAARAALELLVARSYVYRERTLFAALTVPRDSQSFWLKDLDIVSA